jgi:RHS repeat-associated protein
VQFLSTGEQLRITTLPDGTQQSTLLGIDGSRTTMQPEGTTQTLTSDPDPRFGMQAPVGQNGSVTTPDGLSASVSGTRITTLSDPADLLSLSSQTDTVTLNGRTITRAWDAATRTLTDTSPEGRQTRTVLDEQGRPIQQQLGNLTATEFSYDANGRLDGIAQGSRVSSIAYDSDGNVASVTDPAGRTVSFAYDGAGRVTLQTLPDLREIAFDYDANGNVTSIMPPGRPAHGFSYSPTNLLQLYIPPQPEPPLAQPRTAYSYYLDGQLARITRPDGQAINLTYDPETGQLLAQALPTGQVYYRYDVVTGNLERIDAPGETLAYTYDGSLPKSETWSGSVTGSVSRAYDGNFRITSQSVNGGATVAFSYDVDDLLTGAGAMTLNRDATNGLVTGSVLGSVSDALGYNSLGEVTSYQATVASTPVFSESYTRDAPGRITQKTETVQGVTDTYMYSYDPAGRLTDVTTNGTATAHYEYDLNGNRVADANNDSVLTFTQAGTLLDTTYDAQDRLLSSTVGPSTVDYSYTANGELLTKTDANTDTSTTYTYDVLGNLTHVALPSGDAIDYIVDGQNRRVGKAINGTLAQGWLYDGQLRIVAELNGSGVVMSRFVYATKANAPDYVIQGGITYRIVSDHLGSPRLVLNASTGAVGQRTDYDEFGNVVFESVAPGFQRVPFGFAGGLYNPDTGLVRFGARDYDPETGRWSAKDPIGFKSRAPNLYGYALNQPVNRVDPSGLNSMGLTETAATAGLNAVLVTTTTLVWAAVISEVVNSLSEICPFIGRGFDMQGHEICYYVCASDRRGFARPPDALGQCSGAERRPKNDEDLDDPYPAPLPWE